MTIQVSSHPIPAFPPRNMLAHTLMWLIFAFSHVVLVEPAPYEFLIILAILYACFASLQISRQLLPLIVLLGLHLGSLILAAIVAVELMPSLQFAGISAIVYATTLVFSIFIWSIPSCINSINHGYVVAGVTSSILGIAAYFGFLGDYSDSLLRFSRVKSLFKDPNVYGAFLIPPAVYCFLKFLTSRPLRTLFWCTGFICISTGMFLSFSRGSWFGLAFSLGLCLLFLFSSPVYAGIRMRYLGRCLVLGGILVISLLYTSNHESIAGLLGQRFSLVQSYDAGPGGRFSNQVKSVTLLMEKPLGYGKADLKNLLPLDPHNVYLKLTLLSGWLGGTLYVLFVLLTLNIGFNLVMNAPPAIVLSAITYYSAFICYVLMGFIIDTDHWRSYFAVAGILWGLSAYANTLSRAPFDSERRSL